MHRPSHWILMLAGTAGLALVASGVVGDWLRSDARPDTLPFARETRTASPRPTLQVPQHETVTLAGRLVDGFGKPLVGEVWLRGQRAAARRTDADGRFELDVVGGSCHLAARADGYHTHGVHAVAGLTRPLVVALDRALPWQPGEETVIEDDAPGVPRWGQDSGGVLFGEGFLRMRAGGAVAHGLVTVEETGVTVQADETGRYRVPLPTEPVHLVAHDGGTHVARSAAITPSRREGLVPLPTLELDTGLQVAGMLRGPDGEPIAHAPLRLRGPGAERRVVSSADGGFRIEGLVDGLFRIDVLGNEGLLPRRFDVRLEDSLQLPDIELFAAGPRRIRVVDEAEQPQAAVHVAVLQQPLPTLLSLTDDQGLTTLVGIGDEPLRFEVRRENPAGDGADRWRSLEVVAYEPTSGTLRVRP